MVELEAGSQKAHLECAMRGCKEAGLRDEPPLQRLSKFSPRIMHSHSPSPPLLEEDQPLPWPGSSAGSHPGHFRPGCCICGTMNIAVAVAS